MGCAFLWGLWLYITFPFKREEENDIRNGSVWKLLRCDTSMLYSLLTLNTPATHTDICGGSHRAAGALLEHLQVGGQSWLDFSCHWHVLRKCQAEKLHKRRCLEDTGFTRDSRPWSNWKDFSRALQLCCWECTPHNMHLLQNPAPGRVIISHKAKQHQQEIKAVIRAQFCQWIFWFTLILTD